VPASALLAMVVRDASSLCLVQTTAPTMEFAIDRSASATQGGWVMIAAIKLVAQIHALTEVNVAMDSVTVIHHTEDFLAILLLSALASAISEDFACTIDAFASQDSRELIVARSFSAAKTTALVTECAALASAIATQGLRAKHARHKLFAPTTAPTTVFA